MFGNSFESSSDNKKENIKSREVFTDDCDVIGPEDKEDYLEASPTTCGLMTFSDKEKELVGIIHMSFLNNEEGVDELVDLANIRLEKFGLTLKDCERRFFQGTDILVDNLRKVLKNKTIDMPIPESMPEPSLKINKKTGEVEFFTL